MRLVVTLFTVLFLTISSSAHAKPKFICVIQDYLGISPQKKAERNLKEIVDALEEQYLGTKRVVDFNSKVRQTQQGTNLELEALRYSNVELNINREAVIDRFGVKGFNDGEILFDSLIRDIMIQTDLTASEKSLLSEIILRELLEYRHSARSFAALQTELNVTQLELNMLNAKIKWVESQVQLAKLKKEPFEDNEKFLAALTREKTNLEEKAKDALRRQSSEQTTMRNKKERMQQIKEAYPDAANDLIYPDYQYVYDQKGQRRTLQDIKDENEALLKESRELAKKLNEALDTSAFIDD